MANLVDFQVIGMDKVLGAFEAIGKGLKQNRDVQSDIGRQLVRSHRDRIRAGVDPDGKKFRQLKDATLRNRSRRGLGSMPLIAKGRYVKSIKSRVSVGPNRMWTTQIAPVGAVNRMIATVNQFGLTSSGRAGATQIPIRRSLGASAEDRRMIDREYFRWGDRIIRRST